MLEDARKQREELEKEVSSEQAESVDGEETGGLICIPQSTGREEAKSYIRQRVQNASVPEGTVFRKAKPKPSIHDAEEKVVAVYARVSTKSTEQVSSIENQTRYYTEKIDAAPNWSMSRIYADEGKSGTSMKKRTEFRQMLQDAMDKKMDLILCASVSRFARNMSDCMEQIGNLRTGNPSHPVGVFFETENIYTLDPDCDQALSIHAMLADWESANKSRRMILSYDQRICTGQYPVSDLLGFRHTADGQLIIQKDEAVTVEYIFLAKASGSSLSDIAEVLTDKERKTLTGRTDWNEAMVRNILNNERRWGDLEARKTVVIDYKKGKTVKNTDIRDSAYVPNHHTGIVNREIAMAAKVAMNGDGIPELKVICCGALRGYMSICPVFKGVDADALITICCGAYTDSEREKLEYRRKLVDGEEHSRILSMDFTGYHVPNNAFFISKSTPVLTISRGQLRFNRKCLCNLDGCEYIEILYHPLLQALAIRPGTEENKNAIRWYGTEGKFFASFSAKALVGIIYHHMDWIKEYGFRFRGITKERGGQKIIFFFLDEPQILPNGKGEDRNNADRNCTGYIPYRYRDIQDKGIGTGQEKIAAQIGMNYHMRKCRNELFNKITEEDMKEEGEVCVNPVIGEIPSQERMQEKLEELLRVM